MTVVASGETLGSQLTPGSQNGLNCLHPMVEHSERVLGLTARQRAHTIWRLDGGFGTDAAINWLLSRNYQAAVKGYNGLRAKKIMAMIDDNAWQALRPERWFAVVEDQHTLRYARKTQTLALYWITAQGLHKCALLIHTLLDQAPHDVVTFYDGRGAMEVEIKQDKVGLQLVRRRKHRWNAQAAWVTLNDLAHNLWHTTCCVGHMTGCGAILSFSSTAVCVWFKTF